MGMYGFAVLELLNTTSAPTLIKPIGYSSLDNFLYCGTSQVLILGFCTAGALERLHFGYFPHYDQTLG